MEARTSSARAGHRLTTQEASLALMFSEVSIATDRLALCLRTHRRIGAAHALLHLRRLAAMCLRATSTTEEFRQIAMTLTQPLKELDDALAIDRLDPTGMTAAAVRLSFIRFQLWRIECLCLGPTDPVRQTRGAYGRAKAIT
jgi:hypothetical protein